MASRSRHLCVIPERPQVHLLVGEQATSRSGPRGYEAYARRHLGVAVQFRVASAVESNGRLHESLDEVETNKVAFLRTPADNELVPLSDVPDILDLVLVLIGPEGMDVVVCSGRAEHRFRSRGPLFLSVVVMLDTNSGALAGEVVRNIPSCIDVSCAGSTQFIDKKAIGLRNRWRNGRHVGIYPDAGDGEVAWHTNAVGGHDRLQPPVSFERDNLISCQQFDPVRAVDGADQCADLLAQDRLEGDSPGKDGGHVDPELGQGRRHLATDEAHAHYHRVPARHRFALDLVAVSHRAQVVDAGQFSPGILEPPGPSSGGYQDLLILELLAGGQEHSVCGGIDARNTGVREAVYIVLFVPAGRSDVPAVQTLLRPQVRLGERRPAKGDTRFSADDRDPAAVTLLPQGHGGVAPGEGAADDYDCILAGSLRHRAIFPLSALRKNLLAGR